MVTLAHQCVEAHFLIAPERCNPNIRQVHRIPPLSGLLSNSRARDVYRISALVGACGFISDQDN